MGNSKNTFYLAMDGVKLIAYGESFNEVFGRATTAAEDMAVEFQQLAFLGPVWLYKDGEELPADRSIRARKSEGTLLPEDADLAVDVGLYSVEVLNTENRVYTYEICAQDKSQAEEFAWEQANENYHGAKQILSVS